MGSCLETGFILEYHIGYPSWNFISVYLDLRYFACYGFMDFSLLYLCVSMKCGFVMAEVMKKVKNWSRTIL